MKRSLVAAVLLFGPCTYAQVGPVTVAEASAAMDRVDAAIRNALRMPSLKPSADKAPRPVTRAEVVARLDAMFESYRPHFKITPRPFRAEPAVTAQFNKDAKTIASIQKLARFGCIGPVGRLVAGSGDSVSIEVLGEALGYFLSQIAALTYTADPKWTPALMPPDGG